MSNLVNRTETISKVVNNPADPYGPPLVKFVVRVRESGTCRWMYIRKVLRRHGPEDSFRYEFTSDLTYAKLMNYKTARFHQSNLGPECLKENQPESCTHVCLNLSDERRSASVPVPITASVITLSSEMYWWIHASYQDSVSMLFPINLFTSSKAVQEYCKTKGISPDNIIVKYEEEE